VIRLILCLLLALAPTCARANDDRAVVPISQILLPNGDIRYSVPVSVGGAQPVQALLDTGSTGLRIMAGALPDSSYTNTGFLSVYGFGSGDKFTGKIATAPLAFGAAETDGPVPIQIITSVSCLAFRPNCAAATLSSQDYGIGGDGYAGQGFQAILGISLRNAIGAGYTENPLAHIGIKSWIIRLPEPGQDADGSLILNPGPQDLAGFQFFALAQAGTAAEGFADTLPACLNDISSGQSICGPATLDTGSPGITAYQTTTQPGPLWTAGDHAALTISAGNTTVSMEFTTDSTPGTALETQPANGAANMPPNAIVAGVLPFFDNAIWYDAANGRIGLQPRADKPTIQTTTPTNTASTAEIIQMTTPTTALPQVITPGQ
jgi:hypothetical protein